jgi:hypothetical protein
MKYLDDILLCKFFILKYLHIHVGCLSPKFHLTIRLIAPLSLIR